MTALNESLMSLLNLSGTEKKMAGFTSHKAGISSAPQQKAAHWPRNANRVSHLVPFTLTWTFLNISEGI